ncbi:replication-relaxation family protein [Streptomyces kunmingensis]|uniref:Replication-relaxation family protein n=1 Tax=Streptomyces kunmingensis TaxID=68225 RepID=A0ABU6C4M9_9ACTN|nr:replication-relaxation family protein [Streptomyces kunmingensis]MEB3959166.1 replication-relaxation family protein [Streptomyces kunmingensis]
MTRTPHTHTHFVPHTNEDLANQILGMIAQHRMVTVQQLHTVLLPGRRRENLSRALTKLRHAQLADYTVLPASSGTRAWYLTEFGAETTRHLPQMQDRPPYPITSTSAASLRTPHTLTVVRAHAAFAATARTRGDEHGPWDWTPEVAHNLGDGERVIADALMYYTHHTPTGQRTKYRAFVEVDRATMSSERLASKLIDYARFYIHEPQAVGAQRRSRQAALGGPAWLRWYPAFPRILFILTGAGPTALANRIDDLKAMVSEHPTVAALARTVPIGAAVLEDIETLGVDAPVWHCLRGHDGARPWTDL